MLIGSLEIEPESCYLWKHEDTSPNTYCSSLQRKQEKMLLERIGKEGRVSVFFLSQYQTPFIGELFAVGFEWSRAHFVG